MKNFKNVTKRGLAALLALVMIVGTMSLTAFAADEEQTLVDGLLEPGKSEVIDPADKAGQDLIDDTYDALNPDAEATEGKSKEDIMENGAVKGEVLTDGEDAYDNGVKVEGEVKDALTVGDGAETVDKVVKAEAAKAAEALEAAKKATEDAEQAVADRDEEALAQAKADAAAAANKAEEAYNNAQEAFDTVISKLLSDEELEKAVASVEMVSEPGENATDEEKAAYSKYLSDVNTAKMEAANAKIDEMYSGANEQILAAKAALETAQTALETAKDSYDDAVAKAGMAIDDYVKLFEGLQGDETKAQEVADAYGEVDKAEKITNAKQAAADELEPDDSDLTTSERVARDNDFLAGKTNTVGSVLYGDAQLKDAFNIIHENSIILVNSMEQLETETDAAVRAELWDAINKAMAAMYDDTYQTTLLRSPYELIHDRSNNVNYGEVLDVNKGLNAAFDRLTANLETLQAQCEQLKAEEALKQTLAGLSNLTYQEALEVVKGFAGIQDCDAIKDAAEKLAAQKAAADAAQAKVDAANEAYEAAQEAVQAALDKLDQLMAEGKLDAIEFNKAKAELKDAQEALDKAKEDKDQAEEEKKEADDKVIEAEDEFNDFFIDTDIEIDDVAIPLSSGPVTRAEFVDYLWRHEGSPAASLPTFVDVPADHEYAVAIGWAQANGLVTGNEEGAFEPDELVTVAAVRTILGNFARVFGTNVVAADDLTTLTGDEDEAVLNCDEVIAEFFGEEYATMEDAA